ncbi:MAG: hypothetical protein NT070_23375 [Cyanobacteria bacterium]|nr:hypothetical protein [Cyanobacteriota bacterium]
MNLFVSAKKFLLHLTVLLFVFCSFSLTVPSALASQTSFVSAQYIVADATSGGFSNAEILSLINGEIDDLVSQKNKIAEEVASYGKQVKGTTNPKIDAAKAKLQAINTQINQLIAERNSFE